MLLRAAEHAEEKLIYIKYIVRQLESCLEFHLRMQIGKVSEEFVGTLGRFRRNLKLLFWMEGEIKLTSAN